MKQTKQLMTLTLLLVLLAGLAVHEAGLPEDYEVPSELSNDSREGGSIEATLCGLGVGIAVGSILLLSGGTALVVVGFVAPKAAAACLYYAIA